MSSRPHSVDLENLLATLTPGDAEQVRRFAGFLAELGHDTDRERRLAMYYKHYPGDASPGANS